MRRYSRYIFVTVLGAMILYSCRKAYMPAAVTENANLLVVEGIINAGNDSTIIKLSRTVKLATGTGVNAQTGAKVVVEEEGGASQQLQEKPGGRYVATSLNIDNTKRYRIKVTSGSKEYQSDFVEVKITPAIDKVDFDIKTDELDVTVDTHDDAGNSRYYRWEFEETWEFNTNFRSLYKSNGDTVLERDMVNDDVYHCWANDKSKTIILGSSAKLSQDVIKDHAIYTIPGEAERLGIKYSILVKQYALTKPEFEFWQNLKKNTEQLGTIFDPLPSQVKGNIHCVTTPGEIVIGYIGVCTVTQKRSFIDKTRLFGFTKKPFFTDCREDTVLLARRVGNTSFNEENSVFNKNRGGSSLLPTIAVTEAGRIVGHMGTLPRCADCTLRGTTRKPDFWE